MEKQFSVEQYTKYEISRIIGARALQISYNAPILVKLTKEELISLNYDAVKIAELEFHKGVLPINVRRPTPKRVESRGKKIKEILKEEEEGRKEEKKVEAVKKVEVVEEAKDLIEAEKIEEAQGEDEAEILDEIEREEPELEVEEM